MPDSAGKPELRLLGVPEFWNGNATVALIGKLSDLTVLLVAARPSWITRSEAMQQLWGGHIPTTGTSSFRNYLTEMRSVFGPDALDSVSGSIRLSPTICTDVERLKGELHRAESLLISAPDETTAVLRPVVDAFSLGILAGIDLPALEPFRSSVDGFRAAAEDLLLQSFVATGANTADLPLIRKLAGDQPLSELRTKCLLAALVQLGQRREALAEFARFVKRLRDDSGLAPGAEFRALEQEILLAGTMTPLLDAIIPEAPLRRVDIERLARERGWRNSGPVDVVVSLTGGDHEAVQALLALREDDPFFSGGPLSIELSRWVGDRLGSPADPGFALLRLIALEPDSMTPSILSDASRISLADTSALVARFVAKGVLIRQLDSSLHFANGLLRRGVLHRSSKGSLVDLRVQLAGLPSLPMVKRLWHHAAIEGLSNDVLEQLIFAVGVRFENANLRRAASTVAEISTYLMSNESADLDAAVVVRFLTVAANLLDLSGNPVLARKLRNHAVATSLRSNDAVAAAHILVSPAATGRTYRADAELNAMMDRCADMLPPAGHDALLARLLSEQVCREVMENGMTDSALVASKRLHTIPVSASDPELVSSVGRALLHVDLSSPQKLLSDDRFNALRKAVFASQNYDAATDVLTIQARSALARADIVGWRASISEFETYSLTISRPMEVWTRELLWATELQRLGQLDGADEKSRDARVIGSSYDCADFDLAFRVHRLSSHWQRRNFDGFVDGENDELALLSTMLVDSYSGSPALAALDSFVGLIVDGIVKHRPSLATLPALALVTQICWNNRSSTYAKSLLDAFAEYVADIVVVGLIPVSSFGPTERYRAQLYALLGRMREAEKSAERATALARRSGFLGWEALALEDQSDIESLSGHRRVAIKLRQTAVVRRSTIRS